MMYFAVPIFVMTVIRNKERQKVCHGRVGLRCLSVVVKVFVPAGATILQMAQSMC